MEQPGYYHHHPPGRLKRLWLLPAATTAVLMSLAALLLTGAGMLANRRHAFAQDSCTVPECTSTNHFSLDTAYPTTISLTASDEIWVTFILNNPECRYVQFPPADKLSFVARLIVTQESFSISPQSEQSAHVGLVAAVFENRVRLGWIVQPLRLGTYTFFVEVQVYLGSCLLIHDIYRYQVTAVTTLGVTAEGVELLSIIKYVVGPGIAVVIFTAVYKRGQSQSGSSKNTGKGHKNKSRSGKRRK